MSLFYAGRNCSLQDTMGNRRKKITSAHPGKGRETMMSGMKGDKNTHTHFLGSLPVGYRKATLYSFQAKGVLRRGRGSAQLELACCTVEPVFSGAPLADLGNLIPWRGGGVLALVRVGSGVQKERVSLQGVRALQRSPY